MKRQEGKERNKNRKIREWEKDRAKGNTRKQKIKAHTDGREKDGKDKKKRNGNEN